MTDLNDNEADNAHPGLNHPQSLFQSLISCHLEVIVGLHVERCDIVHHLQHSSKPGTIILFTLFTLFRIAFTL